MGVIRREIWTLDEDFELQEDYPSSWNKEEFKNLNSFAARKRYADQHLQKIGSGSARHVYAIDDEKALKLAANNKGLAQNSDEHQISTIGWHDDVVARVFDSHPEDLWIESELARKIKPTRFRELTGFNIQDVGKFLHQYSQERQGKRVDYGKLSDELYEEMVNDEFIMDILSIVDNWDMSTGDWGRISSYGEVKRNGQPQVVLIDYGLTQNTYNTHYMRETLKKEGISEDLIKGINEIMTQQDLEKGVGAQNSEPVNRGGYDGFALEPNSVSQGGINGDVDENLEYNHVTGAAPENDKYYLAEYEEVIHTKFKEDTIHDLARKVSKYFGYNVQPQSLGHGDNGYAYNLGDKILKVTGSETEASESLRVKGKNFEHLAEIYNIVKFDHEGTTLYGILQEKIDTSQQDEIHEYAHNVNTYFARNFKKTISQILGVYIADPNLYELGLADKVNAALQPASQGTKNFYSGMLGIIDDVRKAGLKTQDYFVTDNLGYEDGKLMFFDFGGRYDRPLGKKKIKKINVGEGGDSRYMTSHGSRTEDWQEDMELNERITTWMPKAKSVKVKKECMIGGKGDGTSKACNQGEIENIVMDEINDDNAHRRKDNTTNVAEEQEKSRYYFDK